MQTHPETPGVEKRVFDIEIVHIVEDGLDSIIGGRRCVLVGNRTGDWLWDLDFRHSECDCDK